MSGRALLARLELRREGFHLQVELQADPGVVVVLFGPSGAGKTTVLQAIAGLLTPDRGEILHGGTTLFRETGEEPSVNMPARKRQVGYVFQEYALFPHLTALRNVAYPLWRREGADEEAGALLERMGLERLAHRLPNELSGGQRQRVAIARALAAKPRVLLLDEPFAALDLETRRGVRSHVRTILRELGIPVVLVTHDREEALAMGDRVEVMDEGRVVGGGDPVNVLGHPPKERIARLVGVENLLRLRVLESLPSLGIMRCGRGAFELEVPLSDVPGGEDVMVGIRADDVMVASARPVGLSARNALPGRVTAVEPRGGLYAVTLECGVPLVSHITRRAMEDLRLAPGVEAWAVVKTASCFVLAEEASGENG